MTEKEKLLQYRKALQAQLLEHIEVIKATVVLELHMSIGIEISNMKRTLNEWEKVYSEILKLEKEGG